MPAGRRSDTGRLILGLSAYAARELAATVLVLVGASLLLFLVLKAAPAESKLSLRLLAQTPAGSAVEPAGTPPLSGAGEYLHWLTSALRGEFGTSTALQRGRPAATLIWPSALRSLGLLTVGMTFALALALGAATMRALRSESVAWRFLGAGIGFFSAIPVFFYVYVAVAGGNRFIAAGLESGWWSSPSWFPLPVEPAFLPWIFAALILAVGDGGLVDLYHRFQGEMSHAVSGDYMTGVRMLGISVPGVAARAFIPGALSHVSRRVSFFLGSLVVIEAALGWPGIGYLAWRAAAERDMPVLLGSALVMAGMLRLVAILNDFIGVLADPRRRSGI